MRHITVSSSDDLVSDVRESIWRIPLIDSTNLDKSDASLCPDSSVDCAGESRIPPSPIHPEQTVLFPARIHDVEWMISCSNVVRLWQRHRKTQTKAMAAFAEEPILIDTASRSLLHWMLSFIFLMAVLVAQQCIMGKNELMSCLGLLMLLFYPSVTDQFMISSPFFTVRCFQSRRHLSRWLRNVPAAHSRRLLLHFAYLFYEGIWLDPLIRMHACFLDCCMCMCVMFMPFAIVVEYLKVIPYLVAAHLAANCVREESHCPTPLNANIFGSNVRRSNCFL